MLVTYVCNNIQTWDLQHHVPHELAILFIYVYSFVLNSLIKPARRLFNLIYVAQKMCVFNECKQAFIATKCRIIWNKLIYVF